MATMLIVKKYSRYEHSYMGIVKLSVNAEDVDENVFVVKDSGAAASSISGSSVYPISSSSSTVDAGDISSEDVEYVITTNRTLVSVASLEDLAAYGIESPGPNALYRASTFTVLCRSLYELEQIFELVVSDVRTILRLQRKDYEDFEIVVLEDVNFPNLQ